MKNLGLALIAASFLVASWIASLHPTEVNWSWFVPAVLVGVVGVWIARSGARQEARHGDRLTSNVAVLRESLTAVVAKIETLDDEKASLNPYDLHDKIDELFPEDINRFVDARETIAHVYGLDAYAELMNEFAAGERYLARVWSASVDGYIDEVNRYIGLARQQFVAARDILSRLQ